jgi:hypothetical protein
MMTLTVQASHNLIEIRHNMHGFDFYQHRSGVKTCGCKLQNEDYFWNLSYTGKEYCVTLGPVLTSSNSLLNFGF